MPGDAVDAGLADAGDAAAHAIDDALGAARRPREAAGDGLRAVPQEAARVPRRARPRALHLVLGAVQVVDVVVGGICGVPGVLRERGGDDEILSLLNEKRTSAKAYRKCFISSIQMIENCWLTMVDCSKFVGTLLACYTRQQNNQIKVNKSLFQTPICHLSTIKLSAAPPATASKIIHLVQARVQTTVCISNTTFEFQRKPSGNGKAMPLYNVNVLRTYTGSTTSVTHKRPGR